MRATFRPLPSWPYAEQAHRPATYKVDYNRTLRDLGYEVEAMDGHELLIGLVMDEADIRIDGMVKSTARPRHDGVEVSFEIPSGRRLVFHTDVHHGFTSSWQDNLRAIALGLEALRAVNRYGITSTNEQYAGFAALPSGRPSADRGKVLVERAGSIRDALMRYHPDHGGDARDFADVDAYRKAVGL